MEDVMKDEMNCIDCGYYSGYCRATAIGVVCLNYSAWTPEEPIFKNEYQLKKWLTSMGIIEHEQVWYIDRSKELNYIRKSDLEILIEEAEENYRKVKNYSYSPEFGNSINLLYNCIQAMKTELSKRKDK